MVSGLVPPSGPDWRGAVTVREDPELGGELLRRLAQANDGRSLGVTDLLAPRCAFWRLTTPPVRVPAERQARLDTGRWLHRVVGSVVAPEGLLEVRVRRAGVVGRIDALTDRPIEVKTTSLTVEAADLVSDRPDQLEQLGMYCSLVGRSKGRLVMVAAHGATVHEVRTVDIQFRDLASLAAEMERRLTELRSALAHGQIDRLPRCRWFDRGCEFRSSKVCNCTGREADPPSRLLEEVSSLEGDPGFDRELAARLSKELRSLSPPEIPRFRDLVYPRRAYYDRIRPPSVAEEGPPSNGGSGSNLYARLVQAMESGPVGEVALLPYRTEEPEEPVAAFRGSPYLVRTSRGWSTPRPEEMVRQHPQYALELGFRCAATGTRSGRLLVGFERAEAPDERLKVFAFEFSPVTLFSRLFRERVDRFERAVRDRTPSALDACPGWMYSACPYRSECGCGSEPGRSQR